jgi:hypothetical protein
MHGSNGLPTTQSVERVSAFPGSALFIRGHPDVELVLKNGSKDEAFKDETRKSACAN